MTTPGESGTQFGHLHLGSSCMPWKQVVSGVISIPIRVILHDNPGEFDYLNPVLKTDSQELSINKNFDLSGFTCPMGTCVRDTSVSLDTRLSNYDGIQEIRVRAYVREPDGNVMHASINVLVNIQNGDPENNLDRKAFARAKGWYSDSGYCEADILSELPTGSMDWNPTVQVVWHGSSDDLPVSRYIVTVDADNHAGIPGTVIRSGSGELQPTTLDLSGLSSGTHRLAIRAECDDPRGSTNSGIMQVVWTVP